MILKSSVKILKPVVENSGPFLPKRIEAVLLKIEAVLLKIEAVFSKIRALSLEIGPLFGSCSNENSDRFFGLVGRLSDNFGFLFHFRQLYKQFQTLHTFFLRFQSYYRYTQPLMFIIF